MSPTVAVDDGAVQEHPESWRSRLRRRPLRLRTTLISGCLVMLMALGTAMAVTSYTVMDSYLTRQLDEQLRRSANSAVRYVDNSERRNHGSSATPVSPLDATGQGEGILGAQLKNGQLEPGSGWVDPVTRERHTLSISDVAQLTTVQVTSKPRDALLSMGEYRVVAKTATDGSTIITGLPTSAKQNTLASLGLTLLLVCLVFLALCSVVGAILIRRSLRPLEEVSAVANSVATTTLDAGHVALMRRAPHPDPTTEVGSVALALNRLLDNVEHALGVRHRSEVATRQFLADASHELRTPLAAVQGYVELVSRTEHLSSQGTEAMRRVILQTARMGALVNDLLLLERFREPTTPRREPVDLTSLVLETVSDTQIADLTKAENERHRWEIVVPNEAIVVLGDETLLQRALTNVLSNARKHTPARTHVVTTLSRAADGSPVISVVDNGPGIPEHLVPRIFDRFVRADESRSAAGTAGPAEASSGLGLAIVQAIMESHSAQVRVTSEPGRTEVALHFAPNQPQ